jgi:hypothetical protein
MRVAVLADIHGNLPALDAVLDEIHLAAVDAIVHGPLVPAPPTGPLSPGFSVGSVSWPQRGYLSRWPAQSCACGRPASMSGATAARRRATWLTRTCLRPLRKPGSQTRSRSSTAIGASVTALRIVCSADPGAFPRTESSEVAGLLPFHWGPVLD